MKDLKDLWFDSMGDIICEAESLTMKQEEFLGLERQLEITRERVLQFVPEEDKASCREQLNRVEEYLMAMYNMYLKNAVIAVEFKEIDL